MERADVEAGRIEPAHDVARAGHLRVVPILIGHAIHQNADGLHMRPRSASSRAEIAPCTLSFGSHPRARRRVWDTH